MMARIVPDLTGVPETLLWPLRSRAGMSVLEREFFDDPMAVELYNRIDYDFARFGPVTQWAAIRAKYSDALINTYLNRFPEAQVVALGEGIETQFWRVDNGRVRWLCVELPETITLRRQLLPESNRLTELPLSATDPTLGDHIDPSRGLFVTAAGLFMYLTEEDVRELLMRIGEARDGQETEVFFDAMSPRLSRKSLKGWTLENGYVAPRMPFGATRRGVRKLAKSVPGLLVEATPLYVSAYPERSRLFSVLGKVPFLGDYPPTLVHARFPAVEW
ncbi:class I SAM-dependent methyltransferase [Pukyongiella litopenaei]|nr:class I SAM-dependent methyltransferase [Pukyongiella litopenaei]